MNVNLSKEELGIIIDLWSVVRDECGTTLEENALKDKIEEMYNKCEEQEGVQINYPFKRVKLDKAKTEEFFLPIDKQKHNMLEELSKEIDKASKRIDRQLLLKISADLNIPLTTDIKLLKRYFNEENIRIECIEKTYDSSTYIIYRNNEKVSEFKQVIKQEFNDKDFTYRITSKIE